MSRRGITLIELVVTGAISTVILFVAGHFLVSINSMFQRNLTTLSAEEDLLAVSRELDRLYSRALSAAFTQFGTGAAGYAVFKNGVIALNTDQRPCGTFDPATSPIAVNQTQVGIVCCDANMSVPISPPWGAVTLDSACTNSPGLSIESFQSGTSIGKHCYANVLEMNVMQMGFDSIRKAPLYYHSFGITAAVALPGSPGAVESRQYLEFYRAPGNNGFEQSVPCQVPNLRF